MASKEFVEWSDKYSVGIPLIDEQHKSLLDMINELFVHCKEGEEKANEAFTKTMKKLVDYVKFHFGAEEELLLKYKFPEKAYKEHKNEHEQFVIKVLQVVDDFQNGKKFVPNETVRFLRDWILSHVAIVDKGYSKFLMQKMGIQ